MARLRIAVRNRRGIEASASATRCSKASRSTGFLGSHRRGAFVADRLEEIAFLAHRTLVAERFGLANPAAVEDERVGGSGPPLAGQRAAELLFDDFWVVRFGDPDAVGNPEDVPVDGQAGDAQRMTEHDVRGLTADTR